MNIKHSLALFSLVLVAIGAASFVVFGSFAQFVDDSESEFNLGSYSDTQFDVPNSWVEFDATGLTNGSGDFTSTIFDATVDSSWDTIAWVPERPTGKPLPNSDGVETVYGSGNISNTSNTLLYHLDETSGSASDTSGSAITGTNDGATLGAAGIIGNAIDVTGNGDQIENNSMTMTLGSEVTLAAWFKYSGAGTGSPRILEISRLGNADSTALAPDGDGSLRAWAECNNGTRVGSADEPTSTYDDGEWHHLAYTYDGTTGSLYADGVLEDTGGGSCANLDDPTVLTLGAISDVSGAFSQTQHEFDGYIDEAAIWDRALSATEVLNIYKRGILNFKFQVRSCNDAACVGESFIGPDGTAGTFYEWGTAANGIGTPSFALTNVTDNRYFQYKAFFESEDTTLSPELKSVTVDFTILNAAPATPTNTAPLGGTTNASVKPSLTGSAYFDSDADAHVDTEWQVDDNSNFSTPVWTRSSGAAEESTTVNDTNGVFANELTGLTQLLGGGTYYWRVRYRDAIGNWSAYSAGTSFTTTASSGGGGGGAQADQFPPSNPMILINGGNECTSSTSVEIWLSALNATEVLLSNDPLFIDAEPIPLVGSTTAHWNVIPGEGPKTVYAVFKTSSGVSSITVPGSIVLDTGCGLEPPTEEELEEIIEEIEEVLPDPEPAPISTCDIGCDNNEYVLYIINPDGTRRDSNGDFAKIRLQADSLVVEFEDSGFDMDFNDLVFRMKTQTCPVLSVELLEHNAGWDHQVGIEVIRDGVIFADEIIFDSTKQAINSTRIGTIDLEQTTYSCEATPKTFSFQYVEVFELPNFEGNSEIFEVGSDDSLNDNQLPNDSISSVKLVGDVMVEFFSDAFFGGIIQRLFTDDADLGDNVIGSDTVSSINVIPLVVDPNAPIVDTRVGTPVDGGTQQVEVVPVVESCRLTSRLEQDRGIGEFGADITRLQDVLKCLGFFPTTVGSTGYFGPITSTSILRFQETVILPQSGILDIFSREYLNALQ